MSTNQNAYDPELMAAVRDEEKYVANQQRGSRMVKLERGQIWTVRFLPAHLGAKGRWFARIARHWLNKKPIVCPKHTGEDFGGNEEAYCPCCEAAEQLNQSNDEKVSKFGYSCRGGSQWLTYCIVTAKEDEAVEGNELLMPYEFWHYTSTWEELKAFWKAGTRGGKNLMSVLDYKTGNDFAVSKGAKGLRLDKQDSAPIFDPEDPNFQKYIAKMEAGIKSPKVTIPTEKELDVFARKIEEEAEKLGGGAGPRRSGRPSPTADPGDEEDAPADEAPRRSAPALPGKARRPAPVVEEEPAEEPGEDNSNPELAPVAKKRKLPPQVEPEDEAPAEEEDPAPVRPQTTVPKKRPAPAPVEDEDPAAEGDPEADGSAEDAPPPRRAAAAAAPVRSGPKRASTIASDHVEEDEDALPEESKDAAPPVKKPLARAVQEPVEEEEADAPPPPVARKLGSAMRDKVRAATAREE